jgi:polysaccharide deacetylase 2 family uncharacterized protein YibQ
MPVSLNHLIPRNLPLILWGGMVLALASISLLQFLKLSDVRSEAQTLAFDQGQRLEFNLSTGEVKGLVVATTTTKAPEPAKPAPAKPEHHTEATPHTEHAEPVAEAPPAAVQEPRYERYARPFMGTEGKPRIAIIVSGLGLSKHTTLLALTLPQDVTLSFSPYASNLSAWIPQARTAGYEILVNIPLQTEGFPLDDPGPQAILMDHDTARVEERLSWATTQVAEAVGYLTPGDEVITQDAGAAKRLLESVQKEQAMLIVGRTEQPPEVRDLVEDMGVHTLLSDVRLDDTASANAIDAALQSLEATAKERGYAVAIARPYPVTIERLKLWLAQLPSRGIELAPVSALSMSPASPEAPASPPTPETPHVPEAPQSPAVPAAPASPHASEEAVPAVRGHHAAEHP